VRCTSCGILLNRPCTNPMCQHIHGQVTSNAKQCDWCLQRKLETVNVLSAAVLQYTELNDLLKQDIQAQPRRLYVPPVLQSA
jgi:hypothetical protein